MLLFLNTKLLNGHLVKFDGAHDRKKLIFLQE